MQLHTQVEELIEHKEEGAISSTDETAERGKISHQTTLL